MDDKLVQQVFEELLPSLEALDTECAAILQFLKNKGIATDDELAPYFEQAGNASSVRWRAARVRINHLLSTPQAEEKDKDKAKDTPSSQAPEKTSDQSASKKTTESASKKSKEKEAENADGDQSGASNTTDNADPETTSSAERKEENRKDNQTPASETENAA